MLGQSIGDYLPDLQAGAESMQTDTCTITRVGTGEPAFDHTTGVTTAPPRGTVYTGRCRVREASAADQPETAGEHEYTVQQFVLSLPADAVGVRPDDEATVTASTHDPDLPGRVFVVGAAVKGSQLTARRLFVEEVTS